MMPRGVRMRERITLLAAVLTLVLLLVPRAAYACPS